MPRGTTHIAGPRTSATRALTVAVGAALVLATLMSTGCSEPLFPRREPLTQFDRYDQARRQHVEPWLEDEFGRRRPNLRGRLLPDR